MKKSSPVQIAPNTNLAFDFARSPLATSAEARQLIHALKYQRKFQLSDDLAPFFLELFQIDPRLSHLPENTLLVPVPLHWLRKQWRHGNQAYELAHSLAKLSELSLCPALKRTRHTHTQTRLTRTERLNNLKGAFIIHTRFKAAIQGAHILLIDDVFTTGSTAHECSKVLIKEGNVASVAILTLMRS